MTIDLRLGPIAPIKLTVEPAPIVLRQVSQPIRLDVTSSPIILQQRSEPILLQVNGLGTRATVNASERAEAAETISALKPVVILDGLAYIAVSSDVTHRGFCAGVATTAVNAGAQVTIQTAGRLQDDVWNWDVTKPWIFVGAGVLTQTPPAGWCQVIGRVESADTIFIDIKQGAER